MPKGDLRVWVASDHQGWGDHIEFLDWERRQITGHLTPLPRVGDEYQAKLQSGRTARFIVTEIRPCDDPPDMFFGTVRDAGYVE